MEENKITDKQQGNDITLKELILKLGKIYNYLLSKWPIVMCFGLLGGVLGFAYAHFKKPLYTASTTFVLEEGDRAGGIGQYAGLATMVGLDLGGGTAGGIFQGNNILELYRSRTMIEKTLLTEVDYRGKKQLLVDRYINFNELRKDWDKKPELAGIQFNKPMPFTRLQDSVLGVIVNDIDKNYLRVVKPDKLLSIIKAEVRANDEFFAKAFNNEIVKNVNDFYIQTKTKKSIINVAILQQKADSISNVMDGAIYSGAAAMDATPNLNPTRQMQRTVPMQRSQFSAETNKAVLGELIKNLELSKIALRKETPLIQVIDEPVFPLVKEKTGRLKGIVVGGFLGGLIICLILIIKRFLKEVLA